MSSQKSMLVPLFLISLMLPAVHNKPSNLRCYYLPYTTNETQKIFKLVVTECPPQQLCYSARARYGDYVALTHKGCTLLENCNDEKIIKVKGAVYNASYSCCDWSYCNTATGIAANFVTLWIIIGSLFIVKGL